MSKPNKRLRKTCFDLEDLSDEFLNDPPCRIGYRERVRIERLVFLVAKDLCSIHLDYQLHGMSSTHQERLYLHLDNVKCNIVLRNRLRDSFELISFVQDITSRDPYVHDEALERADFHQGDVVGNLGRCIRDYSDKVVKGCL